MSDAGRLLLRLLLAPAIYGLSVGAIRSQHAALLNVIKLPLLIAVSVAVTALAYFLVARFVVAGLSFKAISRLVLGCYADLGVMLASLSPVCLLFALVFEPASSTTALGEYPLFLGLNVAFIAGAGAIAVTRQGSRLLREHGVARWRGALVVGVWLLLSLVVGGQTAWYLRPFFGNAAVPEDGSFCLGTAPDFRGATSFYEAVIHLAVPPSPVVAR